MYIFNFVKAGEDSANWFLFVVVPDWLLLCWGERSIAWFRRLEAVFSRGICFQEFAIQRRRCDRNNLFNIERSNLPPSAFRDLFGFPLPGLLCSSSTSTDSRAPGLWLEAVCSFEWSIMGSTTAFRAVPWRFFLERGLLWFLHCFWVILCDFCAAFLRLVSWCLQWVVDAFCVLLQCFWSNF